HVLLDDGALTCNQQLFRWSILDKVRTLFFKSPKKRFSGTIKISGAANSTGIKTVRQPRFSILCTLTSIGRRNPNRVGVFLNLPILRKVKLYASNVHISRQRWTLLSGERANQHD